MTQDDIVLVQESWRKALGNRDSVAAAFYPKLFELDATLQPLFEADARENGRKLVHLITTVVRGLDKVEFLIPAVREFGLRQSKIGINDEHHTSVATALLWSLEQTLDGEFTPQVRSAWIVTYGVLSQAMRISHQSRGSGFQ